MMAGTNQTIQSRYVTLQEWAQMMFSKTPAPNTLMRWARDGHIRPPPKKVGKAWQVKRDAEYVE
jgi:predicted site-specific integrase-resolvase